MNELFTQSVSGISSPVFSFFFTFSPFCYKIFTFWDVFVWRTRNEEPRTS